MGLFEKASSYEAARPARALPEQSRESRFSPYFQRTISNQSAVCGKGQSGYEPLQTKRVQANDGYETTLPPIVQEAISSSGQPLDPTTRGFMESRFGHDFSQVRVHTNARAAASARGLNALAYTAGPDIVFAEGRYQPSAGEGRRLLAHELAHVIQQGTKPSDVVQRAEIDDAPEGCADLQDSANLIDELVNGVLRAASSIQDGEERVEFVYQQLGVGSPFSRIEQFCDALPETHQNRLRIAETRFEGSQAPKGSNTMVNAWSKGDKALGTLLNIGGNCIGSDKLGHFFQQGREYFRIAVTLGQPDLVAEDYGRWLEGLDPEHREAAEWITGMSEAGWPDWDKLSSGSRWVDWVGNKLSMLDVSKGVYGLATTGVFSRGDLAANRGGLDFYKALHAGVNVAFKSREIVNGTWNERINPSCFGPEMARLVAAHDPSFHADLSRSFETELQRVQAQIDFAWEQYQRDAGMLVDTSKEQFQADMLTRAPTMARGAILNRHVPKYLCK